MEVKCSTDTVQFSTGTVQSHAKCKYLPFLGHVTADS